MLELDDENESDREKIIILEEGRDLLWDRISATHQYPTPTTPAPSRQRQVGGGLPDTAATDTTEVTAALSLPPAEVQTTADPETFGDFDLDDDAGSSSNQSNRSGSTMGTMGTQSTLTTG